MADLIGTVVAKNYQRIAPSSMFGTRELTFVSVVVDNGGDSDVDLTKQMFEITGATVGAYVGEYTDADSYFSRAVRALQGFAEVFYIGTPDATGFVVAIADDTANDGEGNTGLGVYGNMEAAIASALSIGNKTPVGGEGFVYDGAVTVTKLSAVGNSIS